MKPVIIIAIAVALLIPTSNYSYAEEKVPNWVRNIFLWYGQGEISEDELLNAVPYLIDQGILVSILWDYNDIPRNILDNIEWYTD